jgi:hypothetical protein
MSTKFLPSSLLIFALAQSGFAVAENPATDSTLFTENAGCFEGPMAQFGSYIGKWRIEDSQLQKDGVTWKEGAGARWDFVCLGNGTAVQDFWMPNGGGVGTNLRTYNADSESWDIAWTVTGMSGFAHIQAKQQDNGDIVMMYKSPLPKPLRRITFFPPETNAWNWKLEVSTDDGETWAEVYRIVATRI